MPGLLGWFYTAIKEQKAFLKKEILPQVEEINSNWSGKLSAEDWQKIKKYYGLAVPAVVGEGYCLLRGKPMTREERFRLSYLGAITGLFDDFFDRYQTNPQRIQAFIETPDKVTANTAQEAVFLDFYQKALQFPESKQLNYYIRRITKAQYYSQWQAKVEIQPSLIRRITFYKGGISLLLYRAAFSEPISGEEKRLYYCLGSLGQLENDIFDIYKDLQSGVRTLPTLANNSNSLRQIFEDLLSRTILLVKATDFKAQNKARFSRMVKLIAARGLVALDVLAKAQEDSGGVFQPNTYHRSQLICDMETLQNNRKMLSYFIQY